VELKELASPALTSYARGERIEENAPMNSVAKSVFVW